MIWGQAKTYQIGYKHDFEKTPGDSEGQEAWSAAVHGVSKSQT